jgi:ectoine hydroxylase-related dioxygenase (phytanoyl-CoA dioxygenase family)
MEIADWRATRDLNECYREIRALGLETNLAEIEAFGFTVIEGAIPPDLTERLRQAIIRTSEERSGVQANLETGETHPGIQLQYYLLFRDRAFEEALMNPPVLALMSYLLGKSCLLSSMSSHMKGPGGDPLPLHTDPSGNGAPAPLPPYSLVANCNYALTDYEEGSGGLGVVPGSHRHCRNPIGRETALEGNPYCVPLHIPGGTAVIWHGNTWHGSYARAKPGVRMNLAMYFCRRFVEPQEKFRDAVPQELIDRNGPRFAQLVGLDAAHGWGEEGVDYRKLAKGIAASRSWQS